MRVVSLVVDLSQRNAECSPLVLVVPESEVAIGDTVAIQLWGPEDMLNDWRLYSGTRDLGPGVLRWATDMGGQFAQDAVFNWSRDAVLLKPLQRFDLLTAVCDIVRGPAGDGQYTKWLAGVSAPGHGYFELMGNDILRIKDDAPHYGVISVIGRGGLLASKQVDLEGQWYAQLDYPMDKLVQVRALTELLVEIDGVPARWAAQGEVVTDRWSRRGYSCAQAVDKAALYGSVMVTGQRVRSCLEWQWIVPDGAGKQFFWLYENGELFNRFSLTLPELASSVIEYHRVTVMPYDESSEAPIAGATVYLDGELRGVTDVNGRLSVDGVPSGTHAIKCTASGYLDTDLDELSNEEITV